MSKSKRLEVVNVEAHGDACGVFHVSTYRYTLSGAIRWRIYRNVRGANMVRLLGALDAGFTMKSDGSAGFYQATYLRQPRVWLSVGPSTGGR